MRDRFDPATGTARCREPNCRKCRGLDPKTSRHVGYARRPELGRAKDRGINSEPPTYRPRVYDGSAAEAVAGWPARQPDTARRNGLLEPLATGRLGGTDGSPGGQIDAVGLGDGPRTTREEKHIRRHAAVAGQREDPMDLWKMPRFTNGAKPRISTFRDPGGQLYLTSM